MVSFSYAFVNMSSVSEIQDSLTSNLFAVRCCVPIFRHIQIISILLILYPIALLIWVSYPHYITPYSLQTFLVKQSLYQAPYEIWLWDRSPQSPLRVPSTDHMGLVKSARCDRATATNRIENDSFPNPQRIGKSSPHCLMILCCSIFLNMIPMGVIPHRNGDSTIKSGYELLKKNEIVVMLNMATPSVLLIFVCWPIASFPI